MRSSSYIVAIPVPGTEKSLLFHGYSGAVDLVSSPIANLLTKPASSKGSVGKALSQDTLTHLRTRGYLTEKTPAAEQAYVVELGRRVHAVM